MNSLWSPGRQQSAGSALSAKRVGFVRLIRPLRLLNTLTLSLDEFPAEETPAYVVVSHTWSDDEVTFQDLDHQKSVSKKKGWHKIVKACRLASQRGFSHLWIDTCCIDKSDEHELSKALNSIFEWFKRSSLCFVYLADVAAEDPTSFTHSRWFRRGWTLPELIAPARLEFYSRDWELMGSRSDRVTEISEITGIDPFVLSGGDFRQVTVARRMYWASRRSTTRIEDEAYCLLGLFKVNIPIRYGEDANAFTRLQEEILKTTKDFSIFAWQENSNWKEFAQGLEDGFNDRTYARAVKALAKSPADFVRCGAMFPPLGVRRPVRDDDDLEDEALWDSMSTTSTLAQSSVDEPANAALSHAISFLKDDQGLFPLFQAVMERPAVGVDRFRRILVNILRCLAVELAQEATNKEQRSSASFIKRYRLVIGSAVAASVAERSLKPVELGQDSSRKQVEAVAENEGEIPDQVQEDPEDDEGDEKNGDEEGNEYDEGDEDIQFHSIITFIYSSQAYEQMVERLIDLAYPSFYSRATKFVESLLKKKLHESNDLGHRDAMRSKMLLVISELNYSKPEDLLIDERSELSHLERFQLKLEAMTREEWNWWPWKRPKPVLSPGESRLGWICSCGDARWEAVPEEFAQRLLALAWKFPLANSLPPPVVPAPAHIPVQVTTSTAKGSSSGVSPNPGLTGGTGNTNTSKPSTAHPTASQGGALLQQGRFIFLVTKFGRYALDELPSLHLDTTEFGSELRSAYLRRKGFWKSWLSPYGFSHCDFIKFEKFHRNAFAHRGYGLPDLKLKQYYYRPTSWEPPISPEEFKDVFQYVARKQKSRWAALPLHNTDDDNVATDTVDRIPQRFWNFDKRGNQREDFWGIYVCEQRSALMTSFYIVLSQTPFIGFCFLYSFGYIKGDIQDATTPLALSLTCLGLILGSMYNQEDRGSRSLSSKGSL